MSNASGKVENGKLIIYLTGHIDSQNAASTEAEITAIRKENPGMRSVIDCKDLEYISSAGLRIILRLRKADEKLRIINVSNDVFEVFEMTGFTEMMPIEKAYRSISVEGCEIIGQGSNGIVYRIDPETIVKVYRNPDSLDDIRNEREVARRALILGIPTAIPYDIVRVGETYGSVFEMLNAKSFQQLLEDNPDSLDELVRDSVEVLKKIHNTEVHESIIPDRKAQAVQRIPDLEQELPAESYAKLKKMVNDIPDSCHMIHGDYHVKNLMFQDGEILLIDMDTLAHGDPVFEFAAIYSAYEGFSEIDKSAIEDFLGITEETGKVIFEKTLKYYLGTDDEAKYTEYRNRARLLSLARLLRRTRKRHPENAAFIEHCRENLIRLLEIVDTLAY